MKLHREQLRRLVSSALAALLVYGALPLGVSPTIARATVRANGSPPPVASRPTTANVLRELEDKRTESGREYAMSDGSVQARFFAQPVNYLDRASGMMKPIDVTLADSMDGTRCVSTNRANDFRVELPKQLAGDWVSLETSVAKIALRPAFRPAKGESPVCTGSVPAASVSATERAYPRAFTGATLAYESRPDGIKESIVLAKPSSATVYSFDLKVAGARPRVEPDGSIGLYSSADASPALTLPRPCMWDSTVASGSAGYSDLVHYVLSGSAPGYRLDVVVDGSWLADPARAYPVTIDPGVIAVSGNPEDTYISTGWGNTNFVASKFIWTTYHASGADYTEFGELKLGQDLVSDMASKRAQGYGVVSATANLHSYTLPSPGNVHASKKSTYYISSQLTWNNDDRSNTLPGPSLRIDRDAWYAFDITDMARCWQPLMNVSTSFAAVQLIADSGVHVSFKASETAAQVPWIGLTYYGVPTVALTSPGSGLPSVTVPGQVAWTYAESKTSAPQCEYRIALAAVPGGPALATADVSSASTCAPLPTPPHGWQMGQTYYVQVQVASCPDPSRPPLWSSWTPWTAFRAVPPAPAPVADVHAATTPSSGWFAETPANRGIDDSATAGRGSVTLSWPQSRDATGYDIYLSDGASYRLVGSTFGTSWSSAGKGLYPSDSTLASLPAGFSGNPFLGGTGLDLRDDPRGLYGKTAPTSVDATLAYSFQVVSRNLSGGSAPAECRVALDGRTTHTSDDPRHTTVDLGRLFSDAAQIRADKPDLVLSATDLSIPGVGPDVSVARTYCSSNLTSTALSPGWRFSFQRRLEVGGAIATYYDEVNDAHVFSRGDANWVAPHGDTDRLIGDPSTGFRLEHKDKSTSSFDSAGRLVAECDGSGNTVHYDWAEDGTRLCIRTPKDIPLLHERRISVEFDGAGRATRAVARVGGGEADRVVEYDSHEDRLSVTRLPDTDSARTCEYLYDDSHRISSIAVPGAVVLSNGTAVWSVTYGVQSVSVANETGVGTPRMPRTVSKDSASGIASIASANGTATVTFDALGDQTARTEENTKAAETRAYDTDGNIVRNVSPTGRTTWRTFDSRGNLLSDVDENCRPAFYQYADDLCVLETDRRGSQTSRTFNAAGDVTAEDKRLNESGETAHVSYDYTSDGSLATERRRIDETRTAQIEYSDYADCGESQSVTRIGVELADDGSTTNLVTKQTFDGFGDRTASTDALGVVIDAETLDAAGRVVAATDASGTVTHTSYDCLGHAVEMWRSSDSSPGVKVDWRTSAFDGAGNLVTETVRAADGAVVSTTVHAYDASGREVRADDSSVPGAAQSEYDPQGNVCKTWEEGSDTSKDAAATRAVYNAEGEEVSETDPGATTSSNTTSYTPDGKVHSELLDDGVTTDFAYNAAGDMTAQAVSTDSGPANSTYVSDLDGRQVTAVDENGTTESSSYDLVGDRTGVRLGSQNVSATRCNVLGWAIRTADFDGVVTRPSYDGDGRVVRTDEGGLVTTTDYDGCGRVARRCNPDGTVAARSYDSFGREVASMETSGASVLRTTTTGYDDAGRVALETVSTLGGGLRTRTTTYAPDGTAATTESRRGGGVVLKTVADGAGRERSLTACAGGTVVDYSVTATDAAGRATASTSTALPVTRTSTWRQSGEVSGTALGAAFASYLYSPIGGNKTGEAMAFAYGGKVETSTYTADKSGRLVAALTNGMPTNYSYNADTGALIGYKRGTSPTTTVSYDAVGRLTSAGPLTYRVDALGRRTSQGPSSNASQTTYGWSGARLTSVVTTSSRAAYTYDADGQRIRAVLSTPGATTTTDYDYDGTRLLALSSARSDATTWSIDFLYDANSALYAGVYRSGSGSPFAFLIETTDRGDVRELLDSTGVGFAFYSYDPYGNPMEAMSRSTARVSGALAAAVASRQPLRFSGYVYDAESGLYYCSQRYYDPNVAAFISRDSVKADGEESPHQYCAGDPIGSTDPSGRKRLKQGALDPEVYDALRETIVYNAFYVLKHLKGYHAPPDTHAEGAKSAPDGYADCSGLVTWIMWKSGVFSHSTIANWNSAAIEAHALKKGHPDNKWFDNSKKSPWRIGDIVESEPRPNNHVALIVRDSPDPYIVESSPTYDGVAIHRLSKRKKKWNFNHSGRYFWPND